MDTHNSILVRITLKIRMNDLREILGDPTQIEFNDRRNDERVKRRTDYRPLWRFQNSPVD